VHSTGPDGRRGNPHHSRLEIFGVAEACLDLPVRLIEASLLYEGLLGHATEPEHIGLVSVSAASIPSRVAVLEARIHLFAGSLMLIVLARCFTAFAMRSSSPTARPDLLSPEPRW
jgi:hypothetical protein